MVSKMVFYNFNPDYDQIAIVNHDKQINQCINKCFENFTVLLIRKYSYIPLIYLYFRAQNVSYIILNGGLQHIVARKTTMAV